MTGRNGIRSTIRLGLSAVLVILMVCTALTWLGAQDTAMAKAKPTLSKKTITMKASTGEKIVTATLKVKHPGQKIKWSSDRPWIVKIAKTKGKYKQVAVLQAGSEAGKCVIRAKAGKHTMKCRVTVKPNERKIEIRPLSDSSKDLSETVRTLDPSELFPEVEIPPASGNSSMFAEAVTNFSFQLLKNTLFQEQEKDTQNAPVRNLLVSPDSVLTALLMAENGAGKDSVTEKEMQQLHQGAILSEMLQWELYEQHNRLMERKNANDSLYTMANSIWAREGKINVRPDFLEKNRSLYNASFFEAPFDEYTINDMNNWVFNRTRNMIDKIISDLDEDCRMVLLNAVAFEGQWAQPFTEGQVDPKGTFTCADKTKKTVTMLQETLEAADKPYLGLDCGTGFVKYYQGGKVAFVGLLPPEYMTAEDYLEYLSGEDFTRAWDNRTDAYDVQIKIPEFKYDYDASMKKPLQDMGMKTAFTDDADFSLMREDTEDAEDLKIGDVLHKTHIELDRMGTKAAAATAVFAERAGVTPIEREKREVLLDRPFLYALVDTETGIPLFLGMVNDPGGEATGQ